MYGRFAEIYDAIYTFKDYAAEADLLSRIIRERCPEARTLLDVGCGTGEHLKHLSKGFDCAGVDLSDDQLTVARQKLPEVDFQLGDMRTFEFGRTFDAITCLFGAIAYSRNREELEQTVGNLAKHLNPTGVLLVEPWVAKSAFTPGRFDLMTASTPDFKVARTNTTKIVDGLAVIDFHFLVVSPEGSEHFSEEHRLGLFDDEDYERIFETLGLSCDKAAGLSRGVFVGERKT